MGGENQLPGVHGVRGVVKLAASMKVMMDPMSIFVTEIMTEDVNMTTIMGK